MRQSFWGMEGTLPRGLMGKQRGVVGRTLLTRKVRGQGESEILRAHTGAQKWVPGREGGAELTGMCGAHCVLKY